MQNASVNEFGYIDGSGNKITPYKKIISTRGFSEKTFYFPDGLPGFETNKEFTFIFNEKVNPFILMNLCGDIKLSFICICPFYAFPKYHPNLNYDDRMSLNIQSEKEATFLSIVKIDKNKIANCIFDEGEIILKAPIVINPSSGYCKQIVLNTRDYLENFKFNNLKKLV